MTKREAELMHQGWQRRFCAAEPRLSEMAAIYKETGFEVHLEPMTAVEAPDRENKECTECTICYKGLEDRYKMIYTRPKGLGKGMKKKGDRRRKGAA